MCARDQFIPLRELWGGFSPEGFGKGIFVVFRGYMDESYGSEQNVFAWSCIIARSSHWQELDRKWKLHLHAKNKELKKAGRRTISRYHASDCSSRHGEFEGWSHQERDAFVMGLFGILKRTPLHAAVFDMQLNDVAEVFPEWSSDRLEAAYGLLTMFLMRQIGHDFIDGCYAGSSNPHITLFHDRTAANGKYDPTILKIFNRQIADPTFKYRNCFTTIAPLSWDQCRALQPADLVAFECYKAATAQLEARAQRKSFKALLNMEAFGIHSQTFGKPALKRTRELLEAQAKGELQT